MNVAVAVIGSVLTVLVGLGIWIAIADGIRVALVVIGSTIGIVIACFAIILFWGWVAGVFA